ncbi:MULTISPECIES: TetR family transcriptional regulator [Streptomycetaceae]|uniref:Transcriptional regulator, TetR family n=1 Tax=Streptantibioticus cattleyicolor (strain ATCC 35852 / DSM 46488 / JCM 4925 / NBRC 14057 / NRRL 8057) TaxID=1003195 RepID=F8JRN3_STREN|nr:MULTISPECIES: TetR family transcriptional regulator [Streptomycetaceae]AEW97921.1 transcriptional regulator, TetR family [Streptantibioticus cattleyicolor NRRL 8057 = DSM 46488]MYS62326.1 TetR family transcriptional regulator [Streptomyces sp. SID5468]CCB78236.1 putative TetR family transcriptional regulator [Streptantibioticus cattleyicolor NRRL 8057 = DSM 46488]
MGRWEPDARGRLLQAALELFAEHGFDRTTVAEITARAGLTKRTFFRHFADKRDVLFAGSGHLHEVTVRAVAEAPDSVRPIAAVAEGLKAATAIFLDREGSRVRQAVIAANPELQERELVKLASLSAAIADALRERGVPDRTASLAAEAGIAALKVAFACWLAAPGERDDAPDLPRLVLDTLDELGAVAAGA